MVRKDEPLKVTDLESGGPTDEAGKQSSSSKEPAKSTSVFDRLAYGGGGGQRSRARKVPDEELPNRPSVKSKTANKSNAQQQQPTSGSTSVFDRLSSGERLYRTTTQTGRKPAGRRATEQPEIKQVASIPIQQTEAVDTETAGIPEQTAVVDVLNELDEEEPSSAVPDISLIQEPVTTRPIRPVLKKSARLLRPPAANSQRRKYWRLQRIPTALVERTSLARGALPILPKSLAWLCLVLNGFLPGTGTILSGLLGTCLGAPRFSPLVTVEHKFLALVINLTVGIFQAVTVLFCLVGWCWSLGWGIILVKTAGYYSSWLKNNKDGGQDEHMANPINFNQIKEEPAIIRY